MAAEKQRPERRASGQPTSRDLTEYLLQQFRFGGLWAQRERGTIPCVRIRLSLRLWLKDDMKPTTRLPLAGEEPEPGQVIVIEGRGHNPTAPNLFS